jgi:D-alanine-D-alanine ligase
VVGDDEKTEEVVLLEVNTLPGMTETSLWPEAAGVAGHPFPALTSALVEQAYRRGSTSRNAAIPLPAE